MMWQKLEEILQKLLKAYENLQALDKKKRELLIAVDMKSLEHLLQVEEKLMQSVQGLEKERQAALQELAASYPALHAGANMQQVLQACPTERRAALKQLHRDLSDAVAAAQEISENNKVLIISALNAVNYHLNRFSDAEVKPAYGQQGQELVSRQKKFDFRA